MGIDLLPDDIRQTYQVEERHHACAILETDFPDEWNDLIDVLREFQLRRSDVAKKGGNKSPISRAIDGLFHDRGWLEKSFEIKVTADGAEALAPTHHVDYFKGLYVECGAPAPLLSNKSASREFPSAQNLNANANRSTYFSRSSSVFEYNQG